MVVDWLDEARFIKKDGSPGWECTKLSSWELLGWWDCSAKAKLFGSWVVMARMPLLCRWIWAPIYEFASGDVPPTRKCAYSALFKSLNWFCSYSPVAFRWNSCVLRFPWLWLLDSCWWELRDFSTSFDPESSSWLPSKGRGVEVRGCALILLNCAWKGSCPASISKPFLSWQTNKLFINENESLPLSSLLWYIVLLSNLLFGCFFF